jgi:hypothetical protein
VRRTASLGLLLLLAAATSTRRAAAAPPEASDPSSSAEARVPLALFSGVAVALVPIALGAIHTAGASADGPRNVGYAVAGVGPALSPLVAHAVFGEWGRAAVFGALPVASEIALCAFLTAQPDAVFHGTAGSRTTFGLLFSADIFGAALGLVDVMMAPERARDAAKRTALHGVTLAPLAGPGRAGLVLGGTL